jgi:hypothetical protein
MMTKSHLIVTFGRFNPPNLAHRTLLMKMLGIEQTTDKKKYKTTTRVYMSPSEDDKENLLSYESKIKWFKKFFPTVKELFRLDKNVYTPRTLIDVFRIAGEYDRVDFVFPADRVVAMELAYQNFARKAFDNQPEATFHSSGSNMDEATEKMLSIIKSNDFEQFQKFLPSGMLKKDDCQALFDELRQKMNLNSKPIEPFNPQQQPIEMSTPHRYNTRSRQATQANEAKPVTAPKPPMAPIKKKMVKKEPTLNLKPCSLFKIEASADKPLSAFLAEDESFQKFVKDKNAIDQMLKVSESWLTDKPVYLDFTETQPDEYADMPPLIDDDEWDELKWNELEDEATAEDSQKTQDYNYSCTKVEFVKASEPLIKDESVAKPEDPNQQQMVYMNHFYGWSFAMMMSFMNECPVEVLAEALYETLRQRIHIFSISSLLKVALYRGADEAKCIRRIWDGVNRFYITDDIPDYQRQWFVYSVDYEIKDILMYFKYYKEHKEQMEK